MVTYHQANRPISVSTPLPYDDLLLIGISMEEGLSQLFSLKLTLIAENDTEIAFDKLLGQKILTTLRYDDTGQERYFNGICKSVSERNRDDVFTEYFMEVVPQFWFMKKVARSRIFQHISVPDILKQVLSGLDVSFEIQGTFEPRDYCVQYRETDFHFLSRLMEEEGIYYFFKHTKDGHQMVIANTPGSHPDVTIDPKVIYESILGGNRSDYRVFSFQKVQNLTTGKVTLWDHTFELPHKHLEDEEPITETVEVGTISHKMKLAANSKLELYDFPGGYAQRFDGIDKGGSPRPAELQKIFTDNKRTTKIRIQEEAAQEGIFLQGDSSCRQFTSGHKFTIERHFHSDGAYVLTWVKHTATISAGDYRSSAERQSFEYSNQFTCIPAVVPYRPARKHIKPSVLGSQTAVVAGPSGEEIFTDKYGRIKVQFHWDRQGKYDADSSCWIRVAQGWAGKQWGGVFIPRIGMEVIVDFLEGDPDQPICTGCVYNADFMPPYTLPAEKTKSTIKSMTTIGGEGFNEFRFEDKKGSEQVFIHAQKNMDIRVKNDRFETIERDRHLEVKRDKFEAVTRDKHIEISQHLTEHVKGDHHLTVDKNESMSVGGALSLTVGGGVNEKFKDVHNEEVGKDYHLKAGMKIVIEAGMGITLQCGGNFINIDTKGVTIVGTMVLINSGGAALKGAPSNPSSPQSPTVAKPADKADPGTLLTYSGGGTEKELTLDSSGDAARHDPTSEENKEKKSWIEIVLVDMNNQPIPGERYEIKLPDGETIASGSLDDKGFARVDNIDPGNCKVTFPDLDKDAWEEA